MTDIPKSQFAQTGVLPRILPGAKITRYQVLGERSSGTNFAKRLLGRNTDLTPTELLGWKHGFPHALAIPRDLVVIGSVRAADRWALSMHSKPWHCSPEMQALGFSDFIRAEWDTYVDHPRYFDGAEKLRQVGAPLQHDRHPLTGKRFDNLFALRRAKLASLLSYFDRDCSFILLRMEDATRDPEATLGHIREALSLPAPEGPFKPVLKRLGSKFKAAIDQRPPTPKEMNADDIAFLNTHVHKGQERALGYSY